MKRIWVRAVLAAIVLIAGLAGLRSVTRCRVPFVPFAVEALERGSRISIVSPPPEDILRMAGIQAATLYQADSVTLRPEREESGALRPEHVHVGLYTTGGYLPVEYLVVCRLSGTLITELTATVWEAGTRNGAYTVAPIVTRVSGTPFVVLAWLTKDAERDAEHARLLQIGVAPLTVREVWRSDVHSSSGGGVFMEESLRYSFASLTKGCRPVIEVKKACAGDDCAYRSIDERWEWRDASNRFVLLSSDETPR